MKNGFCVAGTMFMMSLALFADVPLGGFWNVKGDGFSGEGRLPGTLAASGLGKRWTEDDFRKTMDLAQSEALVQEWQYAGKAVWTRTIELSGEDCRYPMELFLERVMWRSEAFWDGTPLGTCDSLAARTPCVRRAFSPPRRRTGRCASKFPPGSR